ncbi:ElyC/SanA/YdcF family protein [Novipirellula sp.]|uniref:ElyC/SanA/YdcF family protein n=1 Tax=Novipirellula sp. TaxID=2795430 RepID=UPI0035644567
MKRVKRIMILDELEDGGFNFVRRSSDTRVQRAIDYLVLHGVPAEKVTKIPAEVEPALGSLSESRVVASVEPGLRRLVVVTSAPHTRRSRLCFERSMPAEVQVQVYAASAPSESSEVDAPIWIEYVKLAIYYFVA